MCRRLRRQEEVEELVLGDQEENESSDSGPLVEGNDEEAESPGPRLMYTLGREAVAYGTIYALVKCGKRINLASNTL